MQTGRARSRGSWSAAALGLVFAGAIAGCRSKDPAQAGLIDPGAGPAGVLLHSGRRVPPADARPGTAEPGTIEAGAPHAGREHFLVEFAREPLLEEHPLLFEEEVVLLEFLGDRIYLASAPVGARQSGSTLARLARWSGPLRPADKLHPDLRLDPEAAATLERRAGELELRFVFFEDVEPERLEQLARELGGELPRDSFDRTLELRFDAARLDAVLAWDELQLVLPPREEPRPQGHVGELQPARAAFAGALQTCAETGKDVRIAICDFGISESHPAFAPAAGQTTRFYLSDSVEDPHATFVASIAAGRDGTTFRGRAPDAQIGNYPFLNAELGLYIQAIEVDGTQVFNHSHMLKSRPVYDDDVATLDSIVRGGSRLFPGASVRRPEVLLSPVPARPQVWAVGNEGVCNELAPGLYEGYLSADLAAKNAIVVGSVDALDEQLSAFSSRGPTYDGRIKPDLVAVGAHDSKGIAMSCVPGNVSQPFAGVQGANHPTTGGAYHSQWGTSYAAPHVAGLIACMMERIEAQGIDPRSLRPSTYKSMLVVTARDRVWTPSASDPEAVIDNATGRSVPCPLGPDYATGFGMVDDCAAIELAGSSARWIEGRLAQSGDVHESCVFVPENLRQLRVALAWDDLPGSISSGEWQSKLVQDLDLELVAPDGRVHFPWSLGRHLGNPRDQPYWFAAAARQRDPLNNVELAEVSSPVPGTWTVRVRAHRLAFGLRQAFALSSSLPFGAFCPRKPPRESTVCVNYPDLCELEYEFPPFDITRGGWPLGPGQVLPLELVRRQSAAEPMDAGPAWVPQPPLRVEFQGLPPGAGIVVFDDLGNLLLDAQHARGPLLLEFAAPAPARSAFFAFVDAQGALYLEELFVSARLLP